mmetsp:Transcript_233/g.507  ORF Transcript_233/g.507 Transcript_233/m.507 type:complete len:174 (+) Transcript_233:186-707(+)
MMMPGISRTLGRRVAAEAMIKSSRGNPHAMMAIKDGPRRCYHDAVIEHYENPRNVGSLDKADDDVGTGLVGAPACGDVMKLQIKVGDDGRIQESKFKTFGCGSAIASSSVATEMIKGMHVDDVMGIKNADIAAHLKLPPVKLHCSMLAEDAIKMAVNDWKAKKEGEKKKQSAA